jgi:TRAP transporter TAXI family solute receptor
MKIASLVWVPAFSFILLPSSFVLSSCANNAPEARFLSIATGGTGGVYYPYGGGIAKVLNEHLPGVRATAEVTGASVDNLRFVRDGRADLALTMGDVLADAVRGSGAFEGQPAPIVALATLYTNYEHLVTLERTGITDIAGLRGRVVSLGSPGSGTEVSAERVLRASGLDPSRDVTRQGLGVSESVGALKDGKIHAFFWMGGVPTPALQDLSYSQGMTMRLVPTAAAASALRAAHGDVYVTGEVPGGIYRGVDAPVSVVGVMNLLVVNASMDEQLAYDITRVLHEHQPELAAIHPEARNLRLESAATRSPAPFHPGAQRYYREKGVAK